MPEGLDDVDRVDMSGVREWITRQRSRLQTSVRRARASRLPVVGTSSDARLADLAAEVEAVGSFLGAHRLQRMGRFAPIIGVSGLVIASEPAIPLTGRAVLSIVILVGVALAIMVPWQRLPRGAQGYVLLVPVVLILLLMTMDSGLRSPYSWLEFLPLLWLVLYERLRIPVVALALVAAVFGIMFSANPAGSKLQDFLPVLLFCITLPRFHTFACGARRSMLAQSERANQRPSERPPASAGALAP